MKLIVKKGRTSLKVAVFIQDSASTTGAGKTALTNASLTCYRIRDDDGNANAVQLTLAGGTRGTWSSGGFVEKDATNMPGVYELGLDNNGLLTGSETVVYMLKGAGVAPCLLEIQLVGYDPQDAVRQGLSALPNANANAVGGLPVLDANSLVDVDVKRWLATAVTAATAGVPDVNTARINNVAAATPGASGGLVIVGTNSAAISFTAGMTISNAAGDALVLTSSGGNGQGLNASGNGTGSGIRASGGTTGHGMLLQGGSGSAASGIRIFGGGTTGAGITITTTSGDGISITPTVGHGIVATGNGTSKHGMFLTGGTAGISDGLDCVAGTGGVDIRGNITGNLSGSVSSLTTNNDKSGYSLTADFRIKKNTALANFPFRLTDSSDHISPKPGLTNTPVVAIALDGATTFTTVAGAVAEKANGWYHVSFTAGELNGDTVALKITGTGADQLDTTIVTQTE